MEAAGPADPEARARGRRSPPHAATHAPDQPRRHATAPPPCRVITSLSVRCPLRVPIAAADGCDWRPERAAPTAWPPTSFRIERTAALCCFHRYLCFALAGARARARAHRPDHARALAAATLWRRPAGRPSSFASWGSIGVGCARARAPARPRACTHHKTASAGPRPSANIIIYLSEERMMNISYIYILLHLPPARAASPTAHAAHLAWLVRAHAAPSARQLPNARRRASRRPPPPARAGARPGPPREEWRGEGSDRRFPRC